MGYIPNVAATDSYRPNARCASGHELLAGAPAVACSLPQTAAAGKVRYIRTDEFGRVYDVEAAENAPAAGKMNKRGIIYRATFEPAGAVSVNYHAYMIVDNATAPRWYPTAAGYRSPRYNSLKWHEKLQTMCSKPGYFAPGTFSVEMEDAFTGETLTPVVVEFKTRDELGRFLKKSARASKGKILALIDEVIKTETGR